MPRHPARPPDALKRLEGRKEEKCCGVVRWLAGEASGLWKRLQGFQFMTVSVCHRSMWWSRVLILHAQRYVAFLLHSLRRLTAFHIQSLNPQALDPKVLRSIPFSGVRPRSVAFAFFSGETQVEE